MVPILGRRSGAGILLAMTKPFNPPRRPVIIACAASAARMRGRALVAWNLRRIRVNRGLSQKKLAFDSGIDRSYVGGLPRTRCGSGAGGVAQIAAGIDSFTRHTGLRHQQDPLVRIKLKLL